MTADERGRLHALTFAVIVLCVVVGANEALALRWDLLLRDLHDALASAWAFIMAPPP